MNRPESVTAGRKLTAMIVTSPVNRDRSALQVDPSDVATQVSGIRFGRNQTKRRDPSITQINPSQSVR